MENSYMPFSAPLLDIIKHTDIEYTFRLFFEGDVKPGQFFEVSLPKYGEAPISVSGIDKSHIDLTIRKVGTVTNEIFNYKKGQNLFIRGPYGNGFDVENYKGKELIIIAGGTGVSPVKGIVDYAAAHKEEFKATTLVAGFKDPNFILFKEEQKSWIDGLTHFILTVDRADEGYEGPIGLVTKYIPNLEIKDIDSAQFIVVGPPMMMKFAVDEVLKRGVKDENIWISHERRMCCGIGKCGHCKIDDTYVCVDGPVFNYTKGKLLRD